MSKKAKIDTLTSIACKSQPAVPRAPPPPEAPRPMEAAPAASSNAPVAHRDSADLVPWERACVTQSLDPCPLLRCPGNG